MFRAYGFESVGFRESGLGRLGFRLEVEDLGIGFRAPGPQGLGLGTWVWGSLGF